MLFFRTVDKIIAIIARTQNLRELQVANTIKLLDGGATIPFISRYRKEMTGGLDEVQIANIQLQNEKLQELCHRREYILTTIEEQGKLTPELKQQLEQCWDATTLEDIYLPYKPKRKTRAEAARKLGLEPLADSLMLHPFNQPEKAAASYVGEGVPDIEAALQGARDIIAERVNENNDVRNIVRRTFQLDAVITSKVVKAKQEEAKKYSDYFDWSEPLKRCSSHRLLAMRRGESEGFLRITITPSDDSACLSRIERLYVKNGSPAAPHLTQAIEDAYKRLLRPSIETEFAFSAKAKADDEAIRVFAENLKQLRKEKQLSQEQLAERAGISVNTLSRLECGQSSTSIDKFRRILLALDADANYLIGLEVSKVKEAGGDEQVFLRFRHLEDEDQKVVAKTMMALLNALEERK